MLNPFLRVFSISAFLRRGFEKIYVGRLFSGYLKSGVLGAWMTFKKAEMAKTLRHGLSMNETNPLNHNWSNFAI